MLKPTSTYKMSKQLKVSLASNKFKDEHQKAAWKRAMIDAELTAAQKPKEKRKGQPDLE